MPEGQALKKASTNVLCTSPIGAGTSSSVHLVGSRGCTFYPYKRSRPSSRRAEKRRTSSGEGDVATHMTRG